MAKILSTLYPGKVDIDANNLDGTFKNRTSDALKDGTPYEKGWSSDVWGFLAHILKKAVISPSGAEENQTNSQYYDALEGLVGRRNVEFETSRDLIFNVVTSKNVQATFSRMSLLDSNFIPKYLDNQDITWDIEAVGVLEAGTSEKGSTNYGAWVDSAGVIKLVPDLESTTDGTTAGKLVDSGATFLTYLVHAGDIVYNLSTLDQTTVSVDATLNGEVLLTDNIFLGHPEDYKIVKMSPLGLGANRERLATAFNNSGSDFDDSYYTQIQEEKDYNGDGTDFTVTGNAGFALTEASASVYQINDWTGLGKWRVDIYADYSQNANTDLSITMTGITFKTGPSQAFVLWGSVISSLQGRALSGSAGTLSADSAAAQTVLAAWGTLKCDKKPSFHN